MLQIGLNENERATIINFTKQDVGQANKLVGLLIDRSVENIKLAYDIYRITDQAERRLVEYDPGETADKLNDFSLILRHVEMLLNIEHINLATRLDVATEETIAQAIREVRSLPEGDEKIALLRRLIDG